MESTMNALWKINPQCIYSSGGFGEPAVEQCPGSWNWITDFWVSLVAMASKTPNQMTPWN